MDITRMVRAIVVLCVVGAGSLAVCAATKDASLVTGRTAIKDDTPVTDPDLSGIDTQKQIKAREALADDPYRPLYHVSPHGKGLHDPAGLCWWKGNYHLFYLTMPPHWGRGHAVSKDLVHWRDLPPLTDSFRGGTGQALVDKDRVLLSFASGRIAIASDALLLDWKEHPNIRLPGAGDNCMWKEGDYYYVGTQSHAYEKKLTYLSGRTRLKLHRSKDLKSWESLGFMFEDGYFSDPGEDCACPNFLPISVDKHLLLHFSHRSSSQYYVGAYDKKTHRFNLERFGRMSYGPVKRGSLHAPTAFIDPKGRCIAMWNIFENRRQEGWDEILSLPRHITLNGDTLDGSNYLNPVCIEPIEELKSLRHNPVEIKDLVIPANEERVLRNVKGKAMELVVEIDPMKAREVGLNVLRSPDGKEQTKVSLFMNAWERNKNVRELMIDVSKASLDSEVRARSPEIGPVFIKNRDTLKLRIFIDRSVIEVFANGMQCLTLRTYPSRKDSDGVSVFARGNDARLINMKAYQMHSIWPELKKKAGR